MNNMHGLVNYLIESTVALAAFYLAYRWLFASDRNFVFNRAYLIFTSALALVLPFFSISALPGPVNALSPGITALQLPELIAGSDFGKAGYPASITNLLLSAYLAGFLFFFGRFAIKLYRIARFIMLRKHVASDERGYILLPTSGILPTCSFFRYLLWDDTAQVSEREMIQMRRHEEIHIHQGHSLDVIYFEILCIVFWFNPLLRAFRQAAGEVHEYLADQSASRLEGTGNYIHLLAAQIIRPYGFTINNHFQQSKMIKRMKMLKNPRKRPLLLQSSLALALAAALTLALACEPRELRQTTPVSQPAVTGDDEVYTEPVAQAKDGNTKTTAVDFPAVEVMPTPAGGMQTFYQFIANNIRYPEEAKAAGQSGKVYVEFVVDERGVLTDAKALRGIGYGCDEEAVRALLLSPAWEPGMIDGKPVSVKLVMPVTFMLEEKAVSEK